MVFQRSGRSVVDSVDKSGANKLWVAVAVGVALVGALVALQLADDGDANPSTSSSDAPVEVKGIQASRPASLMGDIANADGWQVTVTVLSPDDSVSAEAKRDGRYRVDGVAPGPVEVSWVAELSQTSTDGVTLGGQRTGRTQITLDVGRNRYDFSL